MRSENRIKRQGKKKRRAVESTVADPVFANLLAQYKRAVYTTWIAPCLLPQHPADELIQLGTVGPLL